MDSASKINFNSMPEKDDTIIAARLGTGRSVILGAAAGAFILSGLIGFSILTMENPLPMDTINPNTASVASLVRLPGIGPSLAIAIVECRNARPKPAFRTPEDLDAVPRIGPKTIEKISGWLRFDDSPAKD